MKKNLTTYFAASKGRQGRRVALLVGGIAALFVPAVYGQNITMLSLFTQAAIYGLVVVSLNLLTGFGGLVSIGQAGFLAVGAYAAGYSTNHFHLPLPLEILFAGAVAGLVGLVLGLPSGRLSGHYLVIVTLGFGLAVPQIALQASDLTNGFTGVTLSNTQIGPIVMNSPVAMYYFCFTVVAISIILILLTVSSRSGRAIMAVRDSEAAAAAMGVNVARTKVVLFTLSAFFTGVAGDLFAHFQGLINPEDFTLLLSLIFLAAVVVGGLGSIGGSLLGALVLVYIQQSSSSLGGYSELIIGAAVVVVLLVVPDGLASFPRIFYARFIGPKRGDLAPDTVIAGVPVEDSLDAEDRPVVQPAALSLVDGVTHDEKGQ